jgi:hypothetical protein
MLFRAGSIFDAHRMEYVFDTDFVDRKPACVRTPLHILDGGNGRSGCNLGHSGILSKSSWRLAVCDWPERALHVYSATATAPKLE